MNTHKHRVATSEVRPFFGSDGESPVGSCVLPKGHTGSHDPSGAAEHD